MAGEPGQMNRQSPRSREESILTRVTRFLSSSHEPGAPEGQEPVVLFKDPVAEPLGAGAPPPPDSGMIIPLRERERRCAGEPVPSLQEKKEKSPETPPET